MCATCALRTTALCSMRGRTAPCIVSKTAEQPWCGACARSWVSLLTLRSVCSCAQAHARGAVVRRVRRPRPQLLKTCAHCGAAGRLTSGVQPLPPPRATSDIANRCQRADQPYAARSARDFGTRRQADHRIELAQEFHRPFAHHAPLPEKPVSPVLGCNPHGASIMSR